MATLTSPAQVDLTIYQGSALSLSYSWTHNGAIQPLAGYTAKAQIRAFPGGLLVLDLTPYLSINTTTNLVTLSLPANITASMTNDGVWDMFLINTDPYATVKLLEGRVILDRAISV